MNTQVFSEQDQKQFWALMNRPIRTIILGRDLIDTDSSMPDSTPTHDLFHPYVERASSSIVA
jgi:hypothetical protein